MRRRIIALVAVSDVFGATQIAGAEEVTWRGGVAKIVQARCAGCHGAAAKEYSDGNLGDKKDARGLVFDPGVKRDVFCCCPSSSGDRAEV